MTGFSKIGHLKGKLSAYQIEGGASIDGKGPSIWDAFCQQQGTIRDHTSGAIACDHIKHFVDDVALMSQIGLQSYRLFNFLAENFARRQGNQSEGFGFL